MKRIFLTSLIMMSTAVLADKDSDETRLLKSWGFQFNSTGQLVFNAVKKVEPAYQPWSPEIPDYQLTEQQAFPSKILQPLVISSKNKKSENQ